MFSQLKHTQQIKLIRTLIACALMMSLVACKEVIRNRQPLGEAFPSVHGTSLDEKKWQLPQDWAGQPVIVLTGYLQDSQFDIDRWLIGLDMTKTAAQVYEVPTIAGLIPRMISDRINEGMRSGIPKPIWSAVITIYQGGDKIERFTGTERPRNARVFLLDQKGTVRFFTDEGFSVMGLNLLRERLKELSEQ